MHAGITLASLTCADMLAAKHCAHLEHIGHSVVVEHPGQQRIIQVRKVVLAEHDSRHFALGHAVSTPELACRTLWSEIGMTQGLGPTRKAVKRCGGGVH